MRSGSSRGRLRRKGRIHSTRIGGGTVRCPRPVTRASISRSGSISAGCTPIASAAAARHSRTRNCGALLLFDVNNIRYITCTKIGEWERDKLCRFALLAGTGDPILWDFGSAAVHHRLYCDWLPTGKLPCRHARHARHGAAFGRADAASRRGDQGAPRRGRRARTCRSASIWSSRACGMSSRKPG